MAADPRPVVVVVGVASRDLTDEDPRGWRLGGGVSYAALTLARLGVRTRALIGVDRVAAGAVELRALADAGVELVPVELAHGPVFVNDETPAGRVQTSHEVSDPVPVTSIPRGWLAADGWMFAPVAAEVPEAWATVPADDALVAVGWQGILRALVRGGTVRRLAPGPSALITRADLVGVARDDIAAPVDAVQLASFLGPRGTLLVTDGVNGGTIVEPSPTWTADQARPTERRWAAIPSRTVVDPTGAGDTFLAAAFAARLAPGITGAAGVDAEVRFGAAAASLVCEGPGLAGVPTLDAVRERLADADHRRR